MVKNPPKKQRTSCEKFIQNNTHLCMSHEMKKGSMTWQHFTQLKDHIVKTCARTCANTQTHSVRNRSSLSLSGPSLSRKWGGLTSVGCGGDQVQVHLTLFDEREGSSLFSLKPVLVIWREFAQTHRAGTGADMDKTDIRSVYGRITLNKSTDLIPMSCTTTTTLLQILRFRWRGKKAFFTSQRNINECDVEICREMVSGHCMEICLRPEWLPLHHPQWNSRNMKREDVLS